MTESEKKRRLVELNLFMKKVNPSHTEIFYDNSEKAEALIALCGAILNIFYGNIEYQKLINEGLLKKGDLQNQFFEPSSKEGMFLKIANATDSELKSIEEEVLYHHKTVKEFVPETEPLL